MTQDNGTYNLSESGVEMMKQVLERATQLLSFDITRVNSGNLLGYIKMLAACDSLWVGTDTPDLDSRVVLLAITLGSNLHTEEEISAVFTKYLTDLNKGNN